jgi:hypothetical protein
MVDYLLLILNCKNEKYKKNAIRQKKTWLKNIPSNMKYYHIIGDKEKCKNEDICIDIEENIIYCNSLDDYNSLPSKIITTLKGVNDVFEYKYIFKTDDNQMLIKDNFFKVLIDYLEQQPKSHYGGNLIKINENHFSQHWRIHNCLPKILYLEPTIYASGPFYYLSKEAVECLITQKEHFERKYMEDHAVGYYLDPIYKQQLLQMNTNLYFKEVNEI